MGIPISSSTHFPPQEPVQTPAERRALDALERERKEEAEARKTVWAFVWTLFVFKIATVALIIYVASASGESLGLTLSTTWYWLIIPIVAVTGPLLYRWRLLGQRRRRHALRNAEWMVDVDVDGGGAGSVDTNAGPPQRSAWSGPSGGGVKPESIHVFIQHLDDDRSR